MYTTEEIRRTAFANNDQAVLAALAQAEMELGDSLCELEDKMQAKIDELQAQLDEIQQDGAIEVARREAQHAAEEQRLRLAGAARVGFYAAAQMLESAEARTIGGRKMLSHIVARMANAMASADTDALDRLAFAHAPATLKRAA